MDVPMRGTESEVAGMISATSSIKTVNDKRTVIPNRQESGKVSLKNVILSCIVVHKHCDKKKKALWSRMSSYPVISSLQNPLAAGTQAEPGRR